MTQKASKKDLVDCFLSLMGAASTSLSTKDYILYMTTLRNSLDDCIAFTSGTKKVDLATVKCKEAFDRFASRSKKDALRIL